MIDRSCLEIKGVEGVLDYFLFESMTHDPNKLLESGYFGFDVSPLLLECLHLLTPCDCCLGMTHCSTGEVLCFNFGLTGWFSFSRQPPQLMVGVLLTALGFEVRFNPLVTVNIPGLGDRLNLTGEAIAFTLEGVESFEVSG
jgi:hypothetical protein